LHLWRVGCAIERALSDQWKVRILSFTVVILFAIAVAFVVADFGDSGATPLGSLVITFSTSNMEIFIVGISNLISKFLLV
jgi:hypothetical protein